MQDLPLQDIITAHTGTTASNQFAYGHFFVDREHDSIWSDLHQEAVLLSVEEAAYLAREIAHVARRYVEKAEI